MEPDWRWTSFLRGPPRDAEREVKIIRNCDTVLLSLLFAIAHVSDILMFFSLFHVMRVM